jgi:hypothetical protein
MIHGFNKILNRKGKTKTATPSPLIVTFSRAPWLVWSPAAVPIDLNEFPIGSERTPMV